ncbi:MAG: putative thiamine biosynthesis protein [Alphaproteobacteria bacterium MarineAlpha3_Bin7]|nr:MAG: putative thiamine biosynthesis protein [Alphaproteobacteria bacterium MarineAlpha3_Bin7]|tara:strand:+ start:451 stop:1407 length:957 start_codon:yes stop_codon:yes gene_type:complete
MKHMNIKLTFLYLPLLFGLILSTPAYSKDKITLLLDWFINPDHAPIIIAQQKGFFSDEGLDVSIIAPADPNDPPKLVAAGKAELAISYQPQLHVQVSQGLPLIRIGTLVSTPLNSLVVMKQGPIRKISDLKGKKIGYSVGGFEDALLSEMLSSYNLTLKDVELINVNFSLSPALISGKVDAVIGAFRNFELNQMDILNKPGKAFYPEEHGVPVYDELIIVANSKKLNNKSFPKFIRSIESAVQYLINHPSESWKLFIKGNKGLDNELNRRAWRDTLPRLTLRPAPYDRNRYVRFAKFLESKKLIKKALPVEKYAIELR